ncbi:N-acetylglucosamine kinase [Glycomyces buryatensis]|uniref:N-acetylglucosamine kinase n=1 Tax=Glycomyces buryatensis TaxID=2570927 RepID=A0A4S8PVW9_9ACTN|nr:BadF/BadG/BcrA/BcrD ATPase family protein [Glycomyces buryatensis]THV35668.1 N-acetylglucosamine kinase [Glycomyces buryatensis]
MEPKLAVGLDAGGTSTRAVLIDETGAVLGTGASGPANPVGGDRDIAMSNMALAVRRALGGIDPSAIAAVCAGCAGALSMTEEVRTVAAELKRRFVVDCDVELVSDAVVAFAAGSSAPDGTVVVAGTGAVAFSIRGREPYRRSDGYGWLFGDAGSGFWMGREAVRATLRHIDGNGPGGRLVEAIIAAVSPESQRSGALVAKAMADPPARLARLAALVCESADAGDAVAKSIVARAVGNLAESVAFVVERDQPIVMAGSLLTRPTPVASLLQERFRLVYPKAGISKATDPAVGAAWLAARAFQPDPEARTRLHRQLAWR